MYMYMHTYIHICTFRPEYTARQHLRPLSGSDTLFTHICQYIYMYIYVQKYIYIHVHTFIYVYIYIHVCIY